MTPPSAHCYVDASMVKASLWRRTCLASATEARKGRSSDQYCLITRTVYCATNEVVRKRTQRTPSASQRHTDLRRITANGTCRKCCSNGTRTVYLPMLMFRNSGYSSLICSVPWHWTVEDSKGCEHCWYIVASKTPGDVSPGVRVMHDKSGGLQQNSGRLACIIFENQQMVTTNYSTLYLCTCRYTIQIVAIQITALYPWPCRCRTWLDDNASTLLLKLSRRIEDITGLDTTLRTRFSSTELFQVRPALCNLV